MLGTVPTAEQLSSLENVFYYLKYYNSKRLLKHGNRILVPLCNYKLMRTAHVQRPNKVCACAETPHSVRTALLLRANYCNMFLLQK